MVEALRHQPGLPRISLADLPERLPFLYAHVTVECIDEDGRPNGSLHTHQIFADPLEDGIEGAAELLAEAVETCGGKHYGRSGRKHGQKHRDADVKRAFSECMRMLLSDEGQREWSALRRELVRYAKWGGPVPEAVVIPDQDNPGKWLAVVTDDEGNARTVRAPQDAIGLPDPREFGLKKDPILGYRVPDLEKKK